MINAMTRCLDCGSERIADQCPSCGLTSAAAEVMFRRRLLKRTAVFLAGSLAFPYVSQIYPPLDLDLMLVFFGGLFFIALTIAVVLDRGARNRREIEVLKRIYSGFIPLPWILAATLLVNGKLDSHGNRPRHAAPVCAFLARRAENRALSGGFRRLRPLSRGRFGGCGRRAWCAGHSVVLRRLPPINVMRFNRLVCR